VVQILSPVQIVWEVVLPRKISWANSFARIRPNSQNDSQLWRLKINPWPIIMTAMRLENHAFGSLEISYGLGQLADASVGR
jgi:hypothetical protein